MVQFERDKETIRKQIESLLDAEFAGAKAGIEQLQKPLAVGDKVAIEMRRGASVEMVDGIFKGLVGQYVRISSKNILLKDVPELQRDRFIIAQFPERREQTIADNQEKVENALEFRRRQLRPSVLRDTGYDAMFFENNVALGKRIYAKKQLGDGEVFAVLSAVDGEELVMCRVINRSRIAASAVAVLSNSGVGASGEESDIAKQWESQFDFHLPRTRITAIDAFVANLRIICHSPKMGTWALQALPETKRKTTSVVRAGVPKKVHQILISFTLADLEKSDMMKLQVGEVTPQTEVLFRRRAAEGLILQDEMADLRKEIAARAAEAAATLAAQEAASVSQPIVAAGGPGDVVAVAKASSPLNIAALKPILTTLKDSGLKVEPLDRQLLSKPSDLSSESGVPNHLAPAALQKAAIAGGSTWERVQPAVPEGSLELEFAERRFLLGTRGDQPVAFIQLRGMFSSNSGAVEKYTVQIGHTVGEEVVNRKVKFSTPIDWVGKLFLYAEIPVTFVKQGDGNLTIDMKRDAP